MMDQLIQHFPNQLAEALEIGRAAQFKSAKQSFQHVLVAGMGGSGIGGDFVASFIREECELPYLSSKSYQLPAFVGPNSLVIASSYSGNTEETLHAFRQALEKGARVVVIASGGQLIEMARQKELDYIELPAGQPSPRACLGYSLVQQLFILKAFGLISERAIGQVEQAADRLLAEQEDIKSRAENIASFLYGKLPVIYIEEQMEPVALRLRQQINENAKMLCWHNVVPEMNHNELVGWRAGQPEIAVLFFRSKDEFERNQLRTDICKEIIANRTVSTIQVYAKGTSLIERSLYLVHLGDWISYYLAGLQGVDAVEIKVIDHLKAALSKV